VGRAPQNPAGGDVDPLAGALTDRDIAMRQFGNVGVEPEKLGLRGRIFGGLSDAAGAYGAGLQGRAAPPSSIEALRRRREAEAARKERRNTQQATLGLGAAEEKVRAARDDKRQQDRSALEEDRYARGRADSEADAIRDREWRREDIKAGNEQQLTVLREDARLRSADLDKRLAANDPMAGRDDERQQALNTQRSQIARRILFDEDKRGKVTQADIDLALDEYDIVLSEAGIEPGSDAWGEEMVKMRDMLAQHRPKSVEKAKPSLMPFTSAAGEPIPDGPFRSTAGRDRFNADFGGILAPDDGGVMSPGGAQKWDADMESVKEMLRGLFGDR